MTSTTTSTRAASNGKPTGTSLAAPVVLPKGRRRPGLIAAGIALAALGALVAVWLVTSAGDRTEVVVAARDVPYGSTITTADVRTSAVAVDASVPTIAADDMAGVVGQVAATNLVAGALVAPGQLMPAAPPQAGQVLVPLPVTAERVPASGVRAGDRLLVVDTPPAAADPTTADPRTFEVTVAGWGPPDLNGVSVIDVVVDAAQGPDLAVRAATGRFALVLLAAEGQP